MEYFFVYILRCSDETYYVGQTDDIEKRKKHLFRVTGKVLSCLRRKNLASCIAPRYVRHFSKRNAGHSGCTDGGGYF